MPRTGCSAFEAYHSTLSMQPTALLMDGADQMINAECHDDDSGYQQQSADDAHFFSVALSGRLCHDGGL